MAALQPPLPRTAGAAPRRRLRELTRHVSAPACTDAAGLAAPPSTTLTLHLRSRHRVNPRPATPHGGLAAGGSAAAALTPPPEGSTTPPLRWAPREDRHEVAIAQTAIVLIDMWDYHPCPCALERFKAIAAQIESTVAAARAAGVLIVHAPSDCVGGYSTVPVKDMYRDHPARQWVAALPTMEPPGEYHLQGGEAPPRATPPEYPLDASDGGCDCYAPPTTRTWVKETDLITIEEEDALVDGNDGQSLYNIVAARGITTLLYAGVATNMCIMARGTAIMAAKTWGVDAFLIRELTDTMYNPEMSPFAETHEEGTELFVRFLEKDFSPALEWTGVPTLSRFDLMTAAQGG